MKKFLVLFLIIFVITGCASNIRQAATSDESDRTIHLSYTVTSKKDAQYAYYFIKHLDRWYLKLTPDHKSFTLLNSQELAVGTQIDNEEESNGMHIRHLYTVTQFDKTNGIFQMVSPDSRGTWGILSRHFKTILTIKFTKQSDGSSTGTGQANLDIVFDTKTDKDIAVFIGADKIWQKHTETEMSNSGKIIDSLNTIEE